MSFILGHTHSEEAAVEIISAHELTDSRMCRVLSASCLTLAARSEALDLCLLLLEMGSPHGAQAALELMIF